MSGADTDRTDRSSDALLDAPIDHENPWSVGVCSGPLNSDSSKGPLGACLTAGTRCTGSLIAPDLVLTARHCVHEADFPQGAGFCDGHFTKVPLTSEPPRVTPSLSTIGSNPSWYEVDEVLVSPGSDKTCAGDIAILRLKKSIPLSIARPVWVDLRELTAHHPSEVAIVGRGCIAEVYDTETYEIISVDDGGLKRRVMQHIPFVCVSNSPGVCFAADIGGSFDVDPYYVQIGSGTASGDSGSGYIRQGSFDLKFPVLFAVNSSGTADPTTGVPNFGFGLRLDKHAAFIRSALLIRTVQPVE